MAIDTISRALSGQASTTAKQAKETADSAVEQAIAAVPGAVSDWLEDNVTPTTPVVDASLSIAGAAADAKATGDGIANLKSAIEQTNRNLNAAEKIIYNHFNGNYENYAILTDDKFLQNEYCSMAIIECKPNTTYFIKSFEAHNRYVVACGNKKYPVNENVTVLSRNAFDYGYFVTTPADVTYLFVYVSNTNQTPLLYVGTTRIYDYISENSPIKSSLFYDIITDKTIQHSNMFSNAFVTNIFDGNYAENVGLIADSGIFYLENITQSITAIIPVEPNTNYYIRSFDNQNRFRLATSNKIPELGDQYNIILNLNIDNKPTHYNFTTDSEAKWLILTVSNQNDKPRLQIIKNADYLSFIGYNTLMRKEETKYYFLDDIKGIFDSNTVTSPLDASTTRINDIYSIYDSISANKPDYVSMTVIGHVSTENLEMRKYVFNSLQIQNNSAYTLVKPKLLLIAGIHGYEQGSSYCLANVLKQIAEGTDEATKFIRNNIEIIVIPVANPYGYNHNQRKNENGVDLNRNFPAGWVPISDPTNMYYSGASANSEIETQILTDLLNDNNNAFYAVDFHNIASGYPLMYVYTDNQAQFCNSLFATLTSKWNSEYTGFPQNRLLGYCNTGVNACFARQALSIGINAFVAETPWIMPIIGSTQYDINTLTIGNDVFGNILYIIAKALANSKC